jgi:hypothetical protein
MRTIKPSFRRSLLRSAATAMCFAALAVTGADPNPAVRLTYPAPQVTVPPTIDGKLDEWKGVEPVVLADAARWMPARAGETYCGPGDCATRFYLSWDASSLYLAVEAYDNKLVPPSDGAKMLEGDCVVVAVDALNDASQGYREDDSELGFAYASAGALTRRWFPADRAGPIRAARVAVVRELKPGALAPDVPRIKLTYEVAIPWSELPGMTPEVGAAFGFNLVVNDVDASRRHGWLQWMPGLMGIKDPSRFGNIRLSGPLPPPQQAPEAETPEAAPKRPPEGANGRYI